MPDAHVGAEGPVGPVLDTSAPPDHAKKVADLKPDLLLTQEHNMCPGSGEPRALRAYPESPPEPGGTQRSTKVAGIGCYTAPTSTVRVDMMRASPCRAPSAATGGKR